MLLLSASEPTLNSPLFGYGFALGIDFGTNSVRALLVDASNGRELASCVVDYPSGKQGILLDPRDANLARQHPGDYLFGLQNSVRGALEQASKDQAFSPDQVIGIGVDTTGSSPLPLPVLLTTKRDGLLFLVARSSRLCLIPPLQRSTFKDLLDYAALQTFVGMLSRLH